MQYYKLEDQRVVPCKSVIEWANYFEQSRKDDSRRVDKTQIGDAEISTVFLGLDHGFDPQHPLLFETMVFGGRLDSEQERCGTWQEAVAQHRAMCDRVRANAVTT